MIRRYCDICQDEIPDGDVDNQARVIHKPYEKTAAAKVVHLELKITRAVNGVANAGQVCRECLIAAVADGEMTRCPA